MITFLFHISLISFLLNPCLTDNINLLLFLSRFTLILKTIFIFLVNYPHSLIINRTIIRLASIVCAFLFKNYFLTGNYILTIIFFKIRTFRSTQLIFIISLFNILYFLYFYWIDFFSILIK
jgi:hypothetical protein